jgi:uncharacterized membrane protein YfcA
MVDIHHPSSDEAWPSGRQSSGRSLRLRLAHGLAVFADLWTTMRRPLATPAPSVAGPEAQSPTSLRQEGPFARFGQSPQHVCAAVFGIAFLAVEGTLLSAQGIESGAITLTAILVAATLSSIAGFAFSAVCGALLFRVVDNPVHAVQVMIVCSIAIQLLTVATLWRSIDWPSLCLLLCGGFLGLPVGVYLLLHLQTGAHREIIGCLVTAYGGYQLLRAPMWSIRTGSLSDVCVGLLGGLTGGLAAFPGAFVTIWCGMKGWDKARQRGVYQPFILCMQPVTLVVIYLMQPSSSPAAQLDWKMLAFVPAALLGACFGLLIFKRLSDRQFAIAVNALLVASGIGLVL